MNKEDRANHLEIQNIDVPSQGLRHLFGRKRRFIDFDFDYSQVELRILKQAENHMIQGQATKIEDLYGREL